jgi:hypothetical protein
LKNDIDLYLFFLAKLQPVRSAYQPPASSTFLSEQTSHQQPASSTFLSQQISTSHQPPAKRTGSLQRVILHKKSLNLWFIKMIANLLLSVMAMESQAEALGQLATDDLEGKVKLHVMSC